MAHGDATCVPIRVVGFEIDDAKQLALVTQWRGRIKNVRTVAPIFQLGHMLRSGAPGCDIRYVLINTNAGRFAMPSPIYEELQKVLEARSTSG